MIRIVDEAWESPLKFWRLLLAVWGQMAIGVACGAMPMAVLPLAVWLAHSGVPR